MLSNHHLLQFQATLSDSFIFIDYRLLRNNIAIEFELLNQSFRTFVPCHFFTFIFYTNFH